MRTGGKDINEFLEKEKHGFLKEKIIRLFLVFLNFFSLVFLRFFGGSNGLYRWSENVVIISLLTPNMASTTNARHGIEVFPLDRGIDGHADLSHQ